MVMGVRAGLDAATMIDVFNAGSGANTATRDKFPRAVLPRTSTIWLRRGVDGQRSGGCAWPEADELGLALPSARRSHTPGTTPPTTLGPDGTSPPSSSRSNAPPG